jgi:hypothetical protein
VIRRAPTASAAVVALLIASAAALRASAAEDAGDRPLVRPDDGYIGSSACVSCHPGPYTSWHDSYHRTMTQVATRETALGNFEGVELRLHGQVFRLGRDGDALWVELAHGGARERRPVVLSTGSHHDQMYWYTTPGNGRDLLQLPFDWSRRLGRWIPAEMSFLQPPASQLDPPVPAQWNTNCNGCHATHPDPGVVRGEDGRPRFETQVAELGIACEACHGPGAEHAAQNRDPRRRYRLHLEAASDLSIVNPRRLAHDRASEVCGQCHAIREHHSPEPSYRPGSVLAEHATLIRGAMQDPAHPERSEPRVAALLAREERAPGYWRSLYWRDGMVRVSGREFTGFRESPCYVRGELSCISCHALHREAGDTRAPAEWANDQLGVGMDGNAACTQCHASYAAADALAAHTHHAPASSGSQCYDCHMPHSVYGIQKAHRSHQITSPSAAETVATGRVNACNQCHLDRTLAWTAEALERGWGIPKPVVSKPQQTLSAIALDALAGDAGARALAAWHLGWEPALATSGRSWTTPLLVHLLDDPYASVRFVAYLSLRDRPELAGWSYDFAADASRRKPAIAEARKRTRESRRASDSPARAEILRTPSGELDGEAFRALAQQRDDTPVLLAE